jgi:surface polysaccharide O-acyltransferase-like enzyme
MREEPVMNENRLANFDFLRIVALFAIVMGTFVSLGFASAEVSSFNWDLLNIFMSVSRFGFPVLLMLSGAFMLDNQSKPDVKGILKHYVLRLVIVFVIWSLFYALMHAIFDGESVSFMDSLFTGYDHLWFILAVIGLYLITPVLRAFLQAANQELILYFLLLSFLFAFLLPYVAWYLEWDGLSSLLNNMKLRAVGGYLGYFVAGYYLRQYTPDRAKRILLYVMGGIALFITIFLTSANSDYYGYSIPYFYNLFSPAVAVYSVGVYLFFYHLNFGLISQNTERIFYNLSAVSFGAYIVHRFFYLLLDAIGITAVSFTPFLTVPLCSGLVFCLSLFASLMLKKIPFAGKYLG